MTKTIRQKLLGALLTLLVVATGFLGVSLMNGDNAKIAFAETTCTYENGFCTTHNSDSACYYEACTQNSDGYYEIKNGGNMFWFAQKANDVAESNNGIADANKVAVNAIITEQEIDLDSKDWTPIGWESCPYIGTFNGNGATIKNLYYNNPNNVYGETVPGKLSRVGFFGDVHNSTIKNFKLYGAMTVQQHAGCFGTVVGYVGASNGSSSTLENVESHVNLTVNRDSSLSMTSQIGGIAGNCNNSTMRKCAYYGVIDLQDASTDQVGGLVGYTQAGVSNNVDYSAFYGTIKSTCSTALSIGGICGYYRLTSATMSNCLFVGAFEVNSVTTPSAFGQWRQGNQNQFSSLWYYSATDIAVATSDDNTGSYVSNVATKLTKAQLENGEATYRMNDGKTDGTQVWYQTLGSKGDEYPVFSGETVYYTQVGNCTEDNYEYTNKAGDIRTHAINGVDLETDSEDQSVAYMVCHDCGTKLLKLYDSDFECHYTGQPQYSGLPFFCTCHADALVESFYSTNLVSDKTTYEYSPTEDGEYTAVEKPILAGYYKLITTYSSNSTDSTTQTIWKVQILPAEATIEFVNSNNELIESKQAKYGYSSIEKIEEPASWSIPEDDQYVYTFSHWHCNEVNKDYTSEELIFNDVLLSIDNVNWASAPSGQASSYSFHNKWDRTFTFTAVYDATTKLKFNITFQDYDGTTLSATTIDSTNSTYTAPTYTIPSNDYYTYTFKHWYCEQTGENYTSENLPTYEELFNAGYADVTFKAVYDIQYKKSFELEGSIDGKTNLSTSGIYGKDKNVKIVNSGDSVDVYANYAIKTNGGVAALLLIPEYDRNFTIKAVSVNGQLVYGTDATSSEILSGWQVTVSGNAVANDTFKILLESLPASNATGNMFIQIVYTMDSAVTGEYNFGFVTNYYSDTADNTTNDNLSHNDRSEAYGVLSTDATASLCEVKINVIDANIVLVAREDATVEIKNSSVIYDAEFAEVEEDCKSLAEELANIFTYHYSAYGTILPTGEEHDWLQYVTIKWYSADGGALVSAPTNVGTYKLGISAEQNDFFNAVAEQKFDVTITPYTIEVSAEHKNDKTYNGEEQTWVESDFTIQDVIAALNDENGYKLSITNATYKKVGTYTVTLTFTATDNYTFTENGEVVDAGDDKVITIDVVMNKFALSIAAKNQSSQYSDAIQSLGIKYPTEIATNYAFVLTDIGNNTLRFTPSTTATANSPVGTYDITITIEGSSASNYEITLIHNQDKNQNIDGDNGTYTITQKAIDLPTIADLTYNGLEQFPEVTDAATVNGLTAYSFSGDKKINVGEYTLTVTLANNNYKWNSETIAADTLETKLGWKIIAVRLTLSIGRYTTEYGEELAEIIPTVLPDDGLQNGETLASIGVTYVIGDGFDSEKDANGKLPVGTYTITVDYGGTNYEIQVIEGIYEVTKKVLSDETLAEIIAQITGATKDYTGSELEWVYNETVKDFTINGEVDGIALRDIISITAVAAQDDDYINANGKLDNDTWTYWNPETKLYYTVFIKVNDTNSYMLYADENGDAVTASNVDVEVFIKQATNDWTTAPYVNSEDFDNYEHGADAKFKANGEVSIVIKNGDNVVKKEDLVYGTEYTIYFTVAETNNYTGLTKEIIFTLNGYSIVSLPTVYLDEENGTVVLPNGSVTITYDALTHKFIIVPDADGKYTISVSTNDNYASWKNANGEYYVTISVTGNYQWNSDGDRTDKTYTLIINKATLNIVADDKNVSYGDAAPEYTVTTTGFVGDENFATYNFTTDVASYLSCDYVANVTGVGSYDIVFAADCKGDLVAALSNYGIVIVDGTLTVGSMQLELDLSKLEGKLDSGEWDFWTNLVESGYTLEYNAENHTFTLRESSYPEQLVPTITYNDGADLPKNAGVYHIKVVFNIKDGLDANNYSWTNPTEDITLTITKVKLTLTALDQTQYYDGDPISNAHLDHSMWTMSPTGEEKPFMNDEFIFDYFWLKIIDPNYDSTQGYGLGVYKDVLKVEVWMQDGCTEDNYDITYVLGTFTYEKGTLSWEIELTTVNREYNGYKLMEGSRSSYADYFTSVKIDDHYHERGEGELTYSFYTKSGETYNECGSVPIDAGTYYVKAVYTNNIYLDLVSDYVEIVISKASVSVTATAQNRNYLQDLIYGYNSDSMNKFGGSEQSVTYEFSKDNGATWVSDPENKWFTVGNYQVKAIVNESANYQGAEDVATFTINQATLNGVTFTYNKDTATWDAISQTTDGENINKYGDVTVSYRVDDGEVNSLSYTATAVGTYTLIASIDGNDNFVNSESVMVEVFSVSFADKVENHAKTDTVYDFSTVAPTQYRFSGQVATQPDCSNENAAKITIDGYTFTKQWKLSENVYAFTVQVSESITLYASWDINTYTVTWMNDDNTLATEEYEYLEIPSYKGETPTRPSTDEYSYTFDGWSVFIDGEKVKLTAVLADTTYYAIYTKEGISYQVTFMLSIDGGEYTVHKANISAQFGDKLTDICSLADVTWFRGDVWYKDEARKQFITTVPVGGITVYGAYVFDIGNGDVNADGLITTDDITLYRQWIVGGYEMTVVEKGSEWTLVNSEDFDASANVYYLARVADVNTDTSDDIRDITTIRMAIVDGYGYEIAEGISKANVTGEAVKIVYSEPTVELDYTFNAGSDVTLVEQEGKVITADSTRPPKEGLLPSGGLNVFSINVSGIDTEKLVSGETPLVEIALYKGEIAEENKYAGRLSVYATTVDSNGNFTISFGTDYGLELRTYTMTIDVTYQGVTYLQSEFTVTFYTPLTYTFSETPLKSTSTHVFEVNISEDGKTITIDKTKHHVATATTVSSEEGAVESYAAYWTTLVLFRLDIGLGQNIGDGTTSIPTVDLELTKDGQSVAIRYGKIDDAGSITDNVYTCETDDDGLHCGVDFRFDNNTLVNGEYTLSISVSYGNFTWKTAEYTLVLVNF